MPLPRHCLGCDVLIPSGSRCASCAAINDAKRGSTSQRGYGTAWQQLSRQVIREEGACRVCGHTGSKANPLTADHVTPKAQGGTDERSNLQCLCRAHNSAKGARPSAVGGRG